MRHLPAQLILGFPTLEPGDSVALSIAKALAFRAALAFLTASVYPASAAAPTCTTDTHGRQTAASMCAVVHEPPGADLAATR